MAPEAWGLSTGSRDVIVAVIDSGIELDEPWGDANEDGCPGICGKDDDGDGDKDEGLVDDDDEDGEVDEGIHPDLVANIWQNMGEDGDGDGHTIECSSDPDIPTTEICPDGGRWELDSDDLNEKDDDKNGYVDDLVGYDFCNEHYNPDDPKGHGTHVAGIIGATGNNRRGISGVNWRVKIMPLRILPSPIVEQKSKRCPNSTSAALRAVIYARDMGAHITNNSWSQHFNGSQITRKVLENTISLLNDAYGSGRLNTASKREDLLHVFGTGNKSVDLTIPDAGYFDAPTMCTNEKTKKKYPCISALNYLSIENKLLVAASNENDQKSNFSNYGSRLMDLAAPGGDIDNNRNIEDGIYSTFIGNGYAKKAGTSMAAPHVAGVAALIMAYRPTLRGKPLLVKQSILQSADTPQTLKNTRDCPDKGGMPADCVVNGRRLNAYQALRASESPKITGLSLTPGLEQVRLQWRVVTSYVLGIDITYEIHRVHDGKTTIRKTAVTHFTDTGLRSGTRYTYHVRAVKSNGIIGAFSDPVGTSTPEPLPPTMEHFGSHTCAVVKSSLREKGRVYCWGRNDFGQLGDGSKELYKNHVVAPGINSNLYDIFIAVGPYHTCTAKDHNIQCWGRNDHGQLGDKTTTLRRSPVKVKNDSGKTYSTTDQIIDIQAGLYHTCILTDNRREVACWGRNNYGQLGDESEDKHKSHVVSPLLGGDITSIAVGPYHTCAVRNHNIYCWGRNDHGQLGDGTTTHKRRPVQVKKSNGYAYYYDKTERIIDIQAGLYHTCILIEGYSNTGKGKVACWGRNHYGQLGDESEDKHKSHVVYPGISKIFHAVGVYHTCAVTEKDVIYCWGRNDHGQLGDKTTTHKRKPVQVKGEDGKTFSYSYSMPNIQAGLYHTCALIDKGIDGGRVACWGGNKYGQLGDETRTDKNYAVYPSLDKKITSIAVGPYQTCVVRNRNIYCWGRNEAGQLGDTTTIDQSRPVEVKYDSDIDFSYSKRRILDIQIGSYVYGP